MPFAPAVIVFEPRSRWEAELKRRLAAERVLVRPCRSAADLLRLARLMPASAAVIDLAVGPQVALACLQEANLQRLEIKPVLIASADDRSLEWPLRELGAVAFLSESESGGIVADLCLRLLDDVRHSVTTSTRPQKANS